MSTDKDWEKWGMGEPYFGVLSDEKFSGKNLTDEAAKEFYSSGTSDIKMLMSYIKLLNKGQQPSFDHAVDFGCGVGRLSVPLSEYARHVTGLDVSPSMIKKAREKALAPKRGSISYVVSDDNLNVLPQKYDLIYSYIVLQHIPVRRGEKIISKLLDNLQVNGYAAIHVTYGHQSSLARKSVIQLRSKVVPVHYLLNILKGRPMKTPLMRMHIYDLNRVYEKFHRANIHNTFGVLTDHGGYLGVLIVGKKT